MSGDEKRRRRKLEHVQAVARLTGESGAGFDDLSLVPEALPETALDEISMEQEFLGKRLRLPILINAMTGGHPETARINRELAKAAAETGAGMAVGSQTAALADPTVAESYRVARRHHPDGLLLANLGAGAALLDRAREALAMIDADGLQVHLNPAQELVMAEGDRDFRGHEERIADLARELGSPVIVKEVGFGISRETALRIVAAGAAAIDVGGKGGTNFVAVELMRRRETGAASPFADWGLPTAVSLAEVTAAAGGRVPVIASGGIRNGLDMAKALAVGARLVAVAGPLLRAALEGGAAAVIERLRGWEEELRVAMCLTGASDLDALRRKPVVFRGAAAEWLERRGIDPGGWARR